MFTRADLDHLCTLTALELTDAEKEIILPQMGTILVFVSQLDNFISSDVLSNEEKSIKSVTPLSGDAQWGPQLLANIKHNIINNMPHIKTSLTKD